MSFAQPIALLFLGLFIPVILLYLLKQKRRRVPVSTLMFWDQVLKDEHKVTALTKLRKILSLLFQLLFMTLLIFALARPILSSELFGARRIVVLLDISASMSVKEEEGERFDEAMGLVQDVIQGMSFGDTLTMVAVGDELEIVSAETDNKRELLNALAGLVSIDCEADFDAAFTLLHELPEDTRETSVCVISDGAFEKVDIDLPAETTLSYLNVGDEKDNIGITTFQLRPLPASPADFEILLEAVNHTEKDVKAPYEILVNDVLIDAGELALPAGQSIQKTLRQFSQRGGKIEVYVEHADAFQTDNHAYAVLPNRENIEVLLVTEGNFFLENVLGTHNELDVEVVTQAEYNESIISDVVIFDQWAPEKTPSGNTIFINAWSGDLGIEDLGAMEEPLISDWDREHAINLHLNLFNIRIEEAKKIKVPKSFDVLIDAIGFPLVAFEENDTRQVMLTTFDTTASDLPLRVAFPVMISNAVRYMSQERAGDRYSIPTGTVLTLDEVRDLAELDEGDESSVLLYPGEVLAENPDELPMDAENLVPVDRVGIYAFSGADAVEQLAFAANLNNHLESNIAPSDTFPYASETPIEFVDMKSRLGSELWVILASLALALLLLEWVLFHRRILE